METIAEESEQVKRARRKLRKKIDDTDRLVTPEALARMTEEIQLWISRHIKERVDLKEKDIYLFDNNQNFALSTNRYIQRLRERLEEETPVELISDLRGRVQRRNN